MNMFRDKILQNIINI